MTGLCEEYFLSHTVDEAVHALSASPGDARILAGGSDLLLDLQQGRRPPVKRLVDVSEIEEMCAQELRQDGLYIGASVTLAHLAKSRLIKEQAGALADAAALMANPQVCNVATIGGNVVQALPAADGTIALLTLDAQAEVASPAGRRRSPLQALFKGPGQSTLDPGVDLLVGFYLPRREVGEASAFTRRVNPQGIPLALLNVAVWLQREGARVKVIRIAVGPSGPVPARMEAAEEVMRGQVFSSETRARALKALMGEAHFRTSLHRATAEYRQHLVGILLEEALSKAWQRAEQAG